MRVLRDPRDTSGHGGALMSSGGKKGSHYQQGVPCLLHAQAIH